jgi:hypothetical protein
MMRDGRQVGGDAGRAILVDENGVGPRKGKRDRFDIV